MTCKEPCECRCDVCLHLHGKHAHLNCEMKDHLKNTRQWEFYVRTIGRDLVQPPIGQRQYVWEAWCSIWAKRCYHCIAILEEIDRELWLNQVQRKINAMVREINAANVR